MFSAPGSDERTHRQLQGETDHFRHLKLDETRQRKGVQV